MLGVVVLPAIGFNEIISGIIIFTGIFLVQDVASKMEVKAMPTFVLMKDGAANSRLVGANPEEIKKMIDACLRPTSIAE